jgi:hypothetical protein
MLCLLDFSQIVISSAIEYNSQTNDLIELPLLRHIALNNILSYKAKFNPSLDEMIICCDGRDYWRKAIFPNYKQNRKKAHEESDFDWNKFFEHFNQIKTEIKTELPFRVMEVHGCEADDVIAVLCKLNCPHEKEIVIVSSDKDLIQIQDNICSKVKQWSPLHKKFIGISSNNYSLFEHVVKGDSGDGVPNILSEDDVFLVKGKRCKPIRSTAISEWESKGGLNNPTAFCKSTEMLENFQRNRTLIDLQQIPSNVVQRIREHWDNCTRPSVSAFNYLVKHKLRKVLERGGF